MAIIAVRTMRAIQDTTLAGIAACTGIRGLEGTEVGIMAHTAEVIMIGTAGATTTVTGGIPTKTLHHLATAAKLDDLFSAVKNPPWSLVQIIDLPLTCERW